MRLSRLAVIGIFCIFLASCSKNPEVIYINGKIYTLDKNNTIVEAIAVSEGRVLALGKSSELTEKFKDLWLEFHSQIIAHGNHILVAAPGEIDDDDLALR